MKTTVEIGDGLLRGAKKLAVDPGCSLRELVEAGLRSELRQSKPPRRVPKPGEWAQAPGPITLPEGVDLSDRRTLYDWIERERQHRTRTTPRRHGAYQH